MDCLAIAIYDTSNIMKFVSSFFFPDNISLIIIRGEWEAPSLFDVQKLFTALLIHALTCGWFPMLNFRLVAVHWNSEYEVLGE